jgi:putative transposase
LSIRRQCTLLGLNRSTYYYEPAHETVENLQLMRMIDAQYLRTPFYGSRKMTCSLREQGYPVNRKRVQRLMRLMGLEALYPKPTTSQSAALRAGQRDRQHHHPRHRQLAHGEG